MDIYQTQGDPYRDSFYNPVNSANMNPGWGMNPALLTPSYDAPYRPPYMGNTGYSPYERPGFGKALSNVLGPFQDPYWGSPTDNIAPSVHAYLRSRLMLQLGQPKT